MLKLKTGSNIGSDGVA